MERRYSIQYLKRRRTLQKRNTIRKRFGEGGGGGDPLITLSGSLVRFTSSASKPFVSTVASIVPQQDLHGQDAPYPSGGGTNLLNFPNPVTATGEGKPIDAQALDKAIPAGEYTVGITSSAAIAWQVIFKDASNNNVGTFSSPGGTVGRQTKTATLSATASKITIYVNGATTLTNIMMNTGSTALAYAPYSNICPISGWDAVKVMRTGSNIWGGEQFADDLVATANDSSKSQKGEDENGKYVTWSAASGIPIVADLKFKENTQYTIILKGSRNNTAKDTNLVVAYSDGTFSYLQFPEPVVANEITTCVYSTISSKSVVGFRRSWASGTTKFYYEDCGVFEGNLTTSDYEPYNGNTYTIPLGSTVYGGTLTINEDGTATGRDEWTKVVLNGSHSIAVTDWRPATGTSAWLYSSSIFNTVKSDDEGYVISDKLKNLSYANADGIYYGYVGVATLSASPYSIAVRVPVEGLNNSALINAYLAENPIEICYKKATPTTISLTAQQINTLVGENNVWADSGDIEVTVYGTEIVEPDLNALQSLNILLGNRYVNNHEADEPTDEEALDIILGGNTK